MLKKIEKKYSLAVLFFVIFSFVILINFLLVYVSTVQHRQELIRVQRNEKLLLAETIEKIVFSPNIQQTENPQEIIQAFISEFAQTKDVVFIRITDQNGKIEMASNKTEIERTIPINEGVKEMVKKEGYMQIEELYEQESVFTIVYPAGEKFLFLGFSTAAIEAPIATMQKNNVAITLVGSMFSLFFLFLFFVTIVNPLRKIKTACEEIQAGHLETRIDISSGNEIGALAATFNEMLKRLNDSRAREKLIEKLKTEFVSLSAHQLRTPLSAIKWALGMILEGEMGDLTKEQKDLLQKTYQSNERMIYLINDLLNVARIEEGRFLYKLTPARLEDIVGLEIESLETKMKIKNIDFNYKKPEKPLPMIAADTEKLGIAIHNLLNNAINYTPTGGKVSISLASYNKSELIFIIKDTGIGIPEEEQERMFKKFFRGGNVKRGDVSGTGLGMFITKNIIEAHDGKIWFESEEDKGTTFCFTLPISNK